MIKSLARVKFEELSLDVQEKINKIDFLRSCVALNPSNRIIWMVDREKNRRSELEWDSARGCFLSLEEREAYLEHDKQIELLSLGVRAIRREYFEVDTDTLQESFSVYSIDTGNKLLELSQSVYSPVRRNATEFIESELKRADFPNQYATWPANQKINYWVASLYRFRHQVGERGADEDDAFSVDLIEKMRKIDPSVDTILAHILNELAIMENENSTKLIQSFASRTGIHVN